MEVFGYGYGMLTLQCHETWLENLRTSKLWGYNSTHPRTSKVLQTLEIILQDTKIEYIPPTRQLLFHFGFSTPTKTKSYSCWQFYALQFVISPTSPWVLKSFSNPIQARQGKSLIVFVFFYDSCRFELDEIEAQHCWICHSVSDPQLCSLAGE